MSGGYCTECGTEVSEGDRFCTGCGADLPNGDVGQSEEYTERDSYELDAHRLAQNANDKSVTKERLAKKSARVISRLSEKPIIDYLHEEEQPHYIFVGPSTGFVLSTDGNESISPESNYNAFLVVTDQRILGLIGQEDGDEVLSHEYAEISDIEIEQHLAKYKVKIETGNVGYTFHANKNNDLDINAAADYMREQGGLPRRQEAGTKDGEGQGYLQSMDRRTALTVAGVGILGLGAVGNLIDGGGETEENPCLEDHSEQFCETEQFALAVQDRLESLSGTPEVLGAGVYVTPDGEVIDHRAIMEINAKTDDAGNLLAEIGFVGGAFAYHIEDYDVNRIHVSVYSDSEKEDHRGSFYIEDYWAIQWINDNITTDEYNMLILDTVSGS